MEHSLKTTKQQQKTTPNPKETQKKSLWIWRNIQTYATLYLKDYMTSLSKTAQFSILHLQKSKDDYK